MIAGCCATGVAQSRERHLPETTTRLDKFVDISKQQFLIELDPYFIVASDRCESCEIIRAQLAASKHRIVALEKEVAATIGQLKEATKLIELQQADIDRYKTLYERAQPNTPERVPLNQLQLAFARVLASMSDVDAAKTLAEEAKDDESSVSSTPDETEPKKKKKKNRDPHGRRGLDIESLPVERIVIDPDEVVASDGEGFELVDEEVSDRLAFQRGGFRRLIISRRIWARRTASNLTAMVESPELVRAIDAPASRMLVAPLPESVWPKFMADPSAVAQHIIAKYDDSLPLHRQERISARNGFAVPRSTQCGWLTEAYKTVYRIVDAMLAEAIARAFCIATDATGAPVRNGPAGAPQRWHIFVFIADGDHIIFRYTPEHTSDAIHTLLAGFRGHLLSDASSVYDILHRDGVIEVACWYHLRRYFWRAIPSHPQLALEALALIAKLFEINRKCRDISSLEERTATRAARSKPVLELFDAWIARNRSAADPRSPLAAGMGYYENQRLGLRRFLEDARLRLDNSISEQQLRNPILGLDNYLFFENETGLRWYTAFRSLISSCGLHDVNAHDYFEDVLRLAPHWPVTRVLELAPKYWKQTRRHLDARHLAIIEPPWERKWPLLRATSPPRQTAA